MLTLRKLQELMWSSNSGRYAAETPHRSARARNQPAASWSSITSDPLIGLIHPSRTKLTRILLKFKVFRIHIKSFILPHTKRLHGFSVEKSMRFLPVIECLQKSLALSPGCQFNSVWMAGLLQTGQQWTRADFFYYKRCTHITRRVTLLLHHSGPSCRKLI